MRANPQKGCAFVCAADGRIRRVLLNDLATRIKHAGITFPDLVEPDCRERATHFLDRLKEQSASFCYDLRFVFSGQVYCLDCSGAAFEDGFLIIAAPDARSIDYYSNKLIERTDGHVQAIESLHAKAISTQVRQKAAAPSRQF